MRDKIFNISVTCPFLDVLAKRFLEQYSDDKLGLSSMLILVPNRRSAQNLKEAFVRQQGLQPTILPQIEAVGDLKEDELFLSDVPQEELQKLLPAIDNLERHLLFTKIIQSKPENFNSGHFSFMQASELAGELAKLVDNVNNEGLDFSNLQNIVPEEYASHWQETLKFLAIITKYWPEILREKGVIDASSRHNLLLNLKCQQWRRSMPERHIVSAGIYADYPALQELLGVILDLPNGEIYINGLDRNLTDEEWEEITETHPQYQLFKLLKFLQIKRDYITEITNPRNKERERLISEIMRPAECTDKWLDLKLNPLDRDAFSGLKILTCETLHSEALTAALIIREHLEEKENTVALVTADRNLSRMVASELERWGIVADDSAGKPLHLQPVSIYLRQVYEVAQSNFDNENLLSLLKNPFCLCGKSAFEFRKEVRDFEKNFLRNVRKDENGDKEEYIEWLEKIKQKLLPLSNLLQQVKISFRELIVAHLQVAENIANSDTKLGSELLWRGETGKTAAEFFAGLIDKADTLGEINPDEYLDFLEHLLSSETVRRQYGTHPRLKILGPVEARLLDFDNLIIAECNEGIWPPATSADPWMSRSMKKDFGLPLPEKSVGIFANDFANLLGRRNIYVMRAERVAGSPMNKSRWLQRLETVTAAGCKNIDFLYDEHRSIWAKLLDYPQKFVRISAPKPCPDVALRPRKLSVSGLKDLIDNPYKAYAKYILKLFPLGDIDEEPDARLYGTCVHKALELFLRQYPLNLPDNAKKILLDLGKQLFDDYKIEKNKKVFWLAKYEKMINWFLQEEEKIKGNILKIFMENPGETKFNLPAGEFILTAIADRINVYNDGSLKIIDYKTGSSAPTKTAVEAYKEPQLLIEGLIAENGGFREVEKGNISSLSYWQLGKSSVNFENEKAKSLIDEGFDVFKDILSRYDFDDMGYNVKTKPKYTQVTDDYEHLSRIKEWGIQGEDEDE